jgi:hypothetical protein
VVPPTPQEKRHELLGQLNALDDHADNSFALARIEREANALKAANNSHASEVLAVVAMKRRQFDQMYACFKNAEANRGFDPLLQVNFACCLRNAHQYREAADRMNRVLGNFRDDLRVLEEAFVTFAMAPDMENLSKVGHWLENLGVRPPVSLAKIDAHCELLRRKGLTSADLMERHQVVANFLREKKIFSNEVNQALRLDASLRLVHLLEISPEESARLNIEIAELLTYSFEDPLAEVMLISTEPART